MTRSAPAIRFLLLVLGGWTAARSAYLATHWEPAAALPIAIAPEMDETLVATGPTLVADGWGAAPIIQAAEALLPQRRLIYASLSPALRAADYAAPPLTATDHAAAGMPLLYADAQSAAAPQQFSAPAQQWEQPLQRSGAPAAGTGRWSGAAWALVRNDQVAAALAPGGVLGGSQAGFRLAYRVNQNPARPLSVVARGYMPLADSEGAEASFGVEWQPIAGLPVRLLAERRQAIGRNGRSDFAALVHGGVSDTRLPAGLRLDAYAQAGAVGTSDPDAFIDGLARVSLPLGSSFDLRVGGGVWGAAQPGLSRFDAGPQASIRLPFMGERVRLIADWRFRVAGDAEPGSGPALTVATDF